MTPKKTLLALVAAFSFLPLIGFSQLSGHENEVISKFSDHLKNDVAWDNLNGSISAAVIKDNKVIWAKAFGYADKDRNILADTGTVYRIGSITKTFTATLLMLLVEDKKISLDDYVEKYVPEITDIKGYSSKHKITIRQLASHTSGIKRDPEPDSFYIGDPSQWERMLMRCIPRSSLAFTPGDKFLYSNVGYAFLGLALERAGGEPYIDMLQRRIIEPLQMHDTFLLVPDNKVKNMAVGLSNMSGAVDLSVPFKQQIGMGYGLPAGSLYSTPTDLAKFVTSFITRPQILNKASIRKMEDISSVSDYYGLGLMIRSGINQNLIEHDGYVPGYTAQFMVNLDSKYSVIIMRNYNQGSTDLNKVARKLLLDL
ncbi:serine hydrolase domain-containing protein [Mucilaginibacter sp. dw_454]|uniref:serine hydrolase domain-containing protein n=1 Tax=Mucilaginibacter sp. dw_454 TaxID=2720079 RepID=UPI001BD3B7F9|nr:serine hydrolase domain-containing protein [Mucilaginibacter sp. dw_454]